MSVLVLAEHDGHALKPAARHAVAAAQSWRLPVHVLVVGHKITAIAHEAAAITGAAEVIQIDAPHLAHAKQTLGTKPEFLQ